MKQYEYKVFSALGTAHEVLLNGYGKEGWELVAVQGNVVYMKREKNNN